MLFAAYSNSFQAGLVLDDASVIGRDPRIREASAQAVASIVTRPYRYDRESAGLYRPLTTLSYLVNYTVFGNGMRTAGYHWVNLALHAVNVALVYALGIAIFRETAPAWALAALWGLHPVLTESVTNIVGRADLLAALGVLAGFLCHLKAASATGRRRLLWLAGLAIASAVGLFSKESATVLPAIILVYDLAWFDRRTWRARVPSYVLLALPFAAYLYLRAQVHLHMTIPFADNPLAHADFWTARLTAVKVIGKLLWLFVWPARLSADYSYNAIPLFGGQAPAWENAKALLALAVCAGGALLFLLLAVRWRRKGELMLFFLAFFFLASAPTSNVLIPFGSIMAERFLYLPAVGLTGWMVAAICRFGGRIPLRVPANARVAWIALGTVCLAFAARTYARNFDWRDDLSIWTSAAAVCPDSAKAHYNLARTLESLPGRLPEAIAEYRAALRIDPTDGEAHNNLGNALAAIPGRQMEAISEYQTALRLEPGRSEPNNNLGNLLSRMPGRLPEAIANYQAALRIRPDNAEVHYNLANALIQQSGRLPEAIAEYRTALRLDPDNADAHMNLGNALTHLPGRLPEAIAEYRTALRIQPDSVGAHISLANALSETPGGLTDAIAEYRAALRIQPGHAEAHYDLGTALANIPGRLPDAIAEYEAALRNEPDLVEAHVNLGNALAQTPGRQADAMAEYEAALRIRPDPVVRQMVERLRAAR